MSETAVATVSKSMAAEASSAHARINIPLNLANWESLPEEVREDLLWFHQHILDKHLSYKEAQEALNYDETTVFRILKGTYEGSWKNVCAAIAGYKRIVETRGTIQKTEFAKNGIFDLVKGGLDYALANNSITLIIGESRMGKTACTLAWRNENNHGTSVYMVAPPIGGASAFMRRLTEAIGVNKNQSLPQKLDAVARAFNKNRILIVDEAHRLLPGDRRSNPTLLETLRDLHDMTHCALALIATQRFSDNLQGSHYQFEQLLGRIGMPVRLRRKIPESDFRPIIQQYIRHPSGKLMAQCAEIANAPGRLGILVETFKVGSRIASKAKGKLDEEHIFKAIALRRQMMGETMYAKT